MRDICLMGMILSDACPVVTFNNRCRMLGFGFWQMVSVIRGPLDTVIRIRQVVTLGGSFRIDLYARPNLVTGGDHALRYRTDRQGD